MKHPLSRIFGVTEKLETNKDEEKETLLEVDREEIVKVPVEQIIPNRFQPRTIFDEEKIDELARTIHTHGMIQPIVIRQLDHDQYEIIAGERRYRAIKKLGWEYVPSIIKDMNDKQTASIALIENLQREELTPIEEAIAYNQLIEIHELTQEALAQRLGKSQSTVANKLRLLKLPQPIQEALLSKTITERHARALMPLKDEEKQLKVFNEVIEKI